LGDQQQQQSDSDQSQDNQDQGDQQQQTDQQQVAERPEWLPENLWDAQENKPVDFTTLRQNAADMPSSADAYAVPKVEGIDLDAVAQTPFFSTLRQAAFDAGLGQEGFAKIVSDWAEAEKADSDTYFNEQQAKLGANVETRSSTLSTWLDSNLPKEEAAALRSALSSAEVFTALERLMNKGSNAAPRSEPTQVQRATKAEIDSLMASKAYSGRQNERDPAVIAKVDKWFEEEAALEAAAKAKP
jgi:hypothetical protein